MATGCYNGFQYSECYACVSADHHFHVDQSLETRSPGRSITHLSDSALRTHQVRGLPFGRAAVYD